MKRILAGLVSACLAAVLTSGVVEAAPAGAAMASSEPRVQSSDELTLGQAIELALAGSPGIAALLPQSEAARSRASLAELGPRDVLEAELENFTGSGSLSGVSSLESTLRLARVLELGGKRTLRRRVGDAELDRLAHEQQSRRLDVLAETARRFVHLLADQELVAAARRATALGERVRDVTAERVELGAASPASVSRAEIEVARAQLEEEHTEHELLSARVRLAVMWGARELAFARAVGDLFDLPELEDLPNYQARLDAHPDLLGLLSQDRLQRARLHLSQAQRRPDLTVSLGVRRIETFDDQALVAGFSLPLGTRRRAHLEAQALEADRRRLDRDLETRRLELHAALFEFYQEILHARTAAQVLHERIRPQAQAVLETVEQGYLAGRFSLLELADAQRQLLEIERESIRAAADFHTYLIEIARLTGEPVRSLAGGMRP